MGKTVAAISLRDHSCSIGTHLPKCLVSRPLAGICSSSKDSMGSDESHFLLGNLEGTLQSLHGESEVHILEYCKAHLVQVGDLPAPFLAKKEGQDTV
jgi:hypothetical protein